MVEKLDLKPAEVQFALRAVQNAAELAKQVRSELTGPAMTKSDQSPVTLADLSAQALIGGMLARAFPNDPLVAEEDATQLRQPGGKEVIENIFQFLKSFDSQMTHSRVLEGIERGSGRPAERFWVLDPVDGTKGYLREDGQYAVVLALIVGGQVQLGVLGCPNLTDGYRTDPYGMGTLVIARRGQGAWLAHLALSFSEMLTAGFERLHVSTRGNPAEIRLLRSYESSHTDPQLINQFIRCMGLGGEPVAMDSQAKYAVLAAGKGELILRLLPSGNPNYREKIWDIAAGLLVAEEAGGRVTDLDGKPLDFQAGRMLTRNRGIVATNGKVHEAVIRVLKELNA